MSRTIEANFLPSPVEEAKEKPRILIIDDNPDSTYSAKFGWRGPDATPLGKRTNQSGLTKRRNALSPTLSGHVRGKIVLRAKDQTS
jgi:hypothetical protein